MCPYPAAAVGLRRPQSELRPGGCHRNSRLTQKVIRETSTVEYSWRFEVHTAATVWSPCRIHRGRRECRGEGPSALGRDRDPLVVIYLAHVLPPSSHPTMADLPPGRRTTVTWPSPRSVSTRTGWPNVSPESAENATSTLGWSFERVHHATTTSFPMAST